LFDWPKCSEEGCDGIEIDEGCCLAHVSSAGRAEFLNDVRMGHRTLDLRGTTIDAQLFEELLETRALKGRFAEWGPVDFSFATIEVGRGDFSWTAFNGRCAFMHTEFAGSADFSNCEFRGDAYFECETTTFFRISECTFEETVSVMGSCGGNFLCEGATCRALFLMDGFRVGGDAAVHRTSFEGRMVIYNVEVDGHAEFSGSSWHEPVETPYEVATGGWLVLDECEFLKPAHWKPQVEVVSCVGTIFRDAATVAVKDCDVLLDRSMFAGPARVIAEDAAQRRRGRIGLSASTLSELEDTADAQAPPPASMPRIVSVRRADLTNVFLTDVDASECRFFDAAAIDRLRWTNVELGSAPPGRARRAVIAEERDWRRRRKIAPGWEAGTATPAWLEDPAQRILSTADLEPVEQLSAANVAELYRQLRKGREDAKDTPGAADFYYGEMEMRRHAARRISGERLILGAYWAVSGYGLRASRAVLSLVVVLLLAAYGMSAVGFCDPDAPFAEVESGGTNCVRNEGETALPSLADAFSLDTVTYTLGTAVAVVGGPTASLTSEGQAIRVAIRILAPLLIALALLAVRGRVKR
jgi:hypothetical protein